MKVEYRNIVYLILAENEGYNLTKAMFSEKLAELLISINKRENALINEKRELHRNKEKFL